MGTRIRTLTSIGVIKQSGYGTPTHTSTGVTLYTDLNTGIEWENIDGTNWYSETIDRISGDTYNYNLISGLTNMLDIAKTDNAAARFDTTTNQFVQDSKLIIGDDGNLSLDRTTYDDPSVINTLLNFTQTKTSGTGSIRGLNLESLLTSPETIGSQYNIRNYANYSGITTVAHLYSSLNYAQNIGDGYAQNVTGVYSRASNIGNGRVNKLASIVSSTLNTSTNVLNNDMYSFATTSVNSGFADQYYGLQIYQTNVGTVKENIGVQIDLVGTGTTTEKMIGVDIGREHGWEGTALKSYGIYIGNTIGKGTLEKYAIFSESLEDSVFSGNIKTLSDMTILGKIKTTGITGVEYDQDYSTGYTNRSLVDKQFVINSISGITSIDSVKVDVGNKSIYSDLLGSNNIRNGVILGFETGANSSGASNAYINMIGYQSGSGVTNSNFINFIGYKAGKDAKNSIDCIFIGDETGHGASGNTDCVYIGDGAGYMSHTTNNNVFIGNNTGNGSDTSNGLISIGQFAGHIQPNSHHMISIGYHAGFKASGQTDSICIGYQAGSTSQSSYSNFIGYGAGNIAPKASYSNFIGYVAGQGTVAEYSNFIGHYAGSIATNSTYSNFMGENAGRWSTNAKNSIFIGTNAGLSDTVNNVANSGYSILIGPNTNTGGYSNSIAIGSSAVNTSTNQLLISNQITQLNLRGLNYTLPSGQTYGTLSNDGIGNLTWVNNSSNFAFFSVGNESEFLNAISTINTNPLYTAGTIIFKNSFSLTQDNIVNLEAITIDLNGYELFHEDYILSIKGSSFEFRNGYLTRKSGYVWNSSIAENKLLLELLGNAIDISGTNTLTISSARFNSVTFSTCVGYASDGTPNIKFANSTKANYVYFEKCKITSLTGLNDANNIIDSPLVIEIQNAAYSEVHVKLHDSPYSYLGNVSKSIQLNIDAGSIKTWFATDGTINLKNTNIQFQPSGEPTTGNIGIMSSGAGAFIKNRPLLSVSNISASTMLFENDGLLYKYSTTNLLSTITSHIEYKWNNTSNPNLTSKGVVFKGGFFTTELVFRAMSGTTDVINIFSGITEGYVDFDEVINILLTTPVSSAFGGNTYTISQFVNRSSPLTVADSNFGQNIGDGYRYSPTTDFGGTYQISTSSLCKISNGLTLTVNHDVTNNPDCLVSVTLKGTIRGISY